MSDNSEDGWGCAITFLGLFCLFCYPYYDGYVSRSLPDGEAAKVTIEAIPQYKDGKPMVWLLFKNDSDWFIDMRTVSIKLVSADGMVITAGNLAADKDSATEVSPGGFAGGYYRVNPQGEKLLTPGKTVVFEVTAVNGHPRPIKIAKESVDRFRRSVEWLKGQFERT